MSRTELTLDDLAEWLRRYAQIVDENKTYLTELDSAIGDADHGANMARGTAAVVTTLDQAQSIDALLKKAGMTLVSTVGGTSGPLYGTLLMKMGMSTGDAVAVDAEAFGKAVRAGVEGVIARGKTELEDKTMIDALLPSVDAFDKALADGADLTAAIKAAQEAAAAGRDATVPMVARKGRASYLGERSVGHLDPGAASSAYLWDALVDVVSG